MKHETSVILPFETARKAPARFALHGGALDQALRLYPDAPLPWLDLSTGINPAPYPVGCLDPALWSRLPDDTALATLEATATRLYRCPPMLHTVAAPGTQAIIQRLPALLGGSDIRILGRTYDEFARVFADRHVTTVAAPADLAGADVAIVVNPNNPDGRLVPVETLVALAGQVGALVIDEAFMDALDPARSAVPHLGDHPALVLRSFGKFYGLAGLRLGFALAPPAWASRLRRALGPWSVSGPALSIGAKALEDDAWTAATRARLSTDAVRLDALLERAGFVIVGGTTLFRLGRHRGAAERFDGLARAGILARPFVDRPDWLRFGLPGSPEAWRRLAEALRG